MIKRLLSVLMVVLLAFGIAAPVMTANPLEAVAAGTGEWVAAWGAGMTKANLDTMSSLLVASGNCTLRIVVKPTVSGNKVRFKLSNKFGDSPVTINRMTVAKISSGSGRKKLHGDLFSGEFFDGVCSGKCKNRCH